MVKFQQIDQIYHAANTLSGFKSTFDYLSNLNHILHKYLPEHLAPLCHVGAIDQTKHIVVVYVSDQQILHIIKNLSETLLHAFYAANCPFDKLLVKVTLTNSSSKMVRQKPLNPRMKAKLGELAIAIGKPELIIDYVEDDSDEDEIKL